MRKQFRILIILGILLFVPALVFAQAPTHIKFSRGATSAIASGSLKNYKSQKVFVIRVRRGQVLRTEQIKSDSSLHYITVSIKSPSGEDISDSDASCNNRKKIEPTEAGDYEITVYECQKADPWHGNFNLKISVK